MGFGIIHAMIGFDAESSMTIAMTPAVVSARLLGYGAAAGLAYAASRYIVSVDDMWLVIRGAVFPLVVVGYTMVVITRSAFVPSIIALVGSSIYDAAFFLGCLMMLKQTRVGLVRILGVGFGVRELGFFGGAVIGFLLGDYGAIADQTESAVALLVVFVVLSVGTFWVGSERDMRKWWGLRIEASPEYRRDELLQEKCRSLSARFGLSARESEVMLLVARGKRPAQIGEECCLSVFTVRNHIQNIYRKLDIHSRDELDALLESCQVLA